MKTKKKILILNYEFPPLGGGAGNATKYLLNEFARNQQLEIDLVTSSINGFKVNKISNNITIHYLGINKDIQSIHYQTNRDLLTFTIKAFLYSKKLINNSNYDLVHTFFGIPCGFIAKFLGLPYIVCLRGSDVPFYNDRFKVLDTIFFQWLSKTIWKTAYAVIANSHNLKKLALKSSPKQKIDVVFNGVDLTEFKRSYKKKPNQEKLKLISTGRLIQRKGYEYLIKSISNMSYVELQLVGDGNLMEYLKSLAKQYNANVEFLGQYDHIDINRLLQNSDVFVLPSLNEGMSNSLLEAMACGLPIITTSTGDSEALIKGNGFIVKKGSVSDIKSKIQLYLDNRDMIDKHGKQSRMIAESMDWEKIARQFLNIYFNG